MTYIKKNKESAFICIAITIASLVMGILFKLSEYRMLGGLQFLDPGVHKAFGILCGIIIFLIPYEMIIFISRMFFDKTEREPIINRMLAFYFVYILTELVISFTRDLKVGYSYSDKRIFIFLSTMALIAIIIESFSIIKNNIALFAFNFILIILKMYDIFSVTESAYRVILTTAAIIIGCNICYFIYDRKYKLVNAIVSTAGCISFFLLIICCTWRSRWKRALIAIFNPSDKFHISYSWERIEIRKLPLFSMPEDVSWYTKYKHPFIMINYNLGVAALITVLLMFIVITVAVVRSYKILSKNRFSALMFIYLIFAVSFLYSLLADLGLLNPAGDVPLATVNLAFIMTMLAIRLFFVFPIPQKVKDYFIFKYYEDEEIENDDEIDLEESEEIVLLKTIGQRLDRIEEIQALLLEEIDKIKNDKIKSNENDFKEREHE